MVDAGHFGKRTGQSRLALTVAAALVVAGLVAGGAVLFLREHDRELVILKADQEPYKVRPSDPGGKKLENLDSPVLGMLDPLNDKDTGREVLTPPETAPEPPPISVDETDAASPEATETATPAENGEAAPSQPAGQEEPAAVASAAEPESATPSSDEQSTPKAANNEIGEAVAQVTAPKTPSEGGEPLFVVQFAAFKSEKNAASTAAVLASKHESRLGGVGIGYTQRGEFWRVVTDPLPRADASALCATFRSVGQDCIVKLMDQT